MVTEVHNADGDCACEPSPAEGETIRVLLIDDDHDDYILTQELLSDVSGVRFELDWTSDIDQGIDAICAGKHEIVLLDYHLGAITGIELLQTAKKRGCSAPVILLTGQDQSHVDHEALQAGADDYLEKASLTPALLERSIRFALAQHKAAAQLERKVRERTEELAQANAALQEADRRKDIFIATLAHELRNPLAPIRNSLEIIRLSGDAGENVKRQRERMERQVAQLIRLVEDLLDVSRITADKLKLTLESVVLQEVLESALDMFRSPIEAAELKLDWQLPVTPILLSGDRVRLVQIFGNLLNNAVKFSEPGGTISVVAQVLESTAVVTIRDTGVGIAPDVMPHIFDMFMQGDRKLNRSQAGLGIGLALSRRLAEMHGGNLSAASDGTGKGSSFTVRLTLPTQGESTAAGGGTTGFGAPFDASAASFE